MASKPVPPPAAFAAGVAIRAVVLAALAFAAFELLLRTQLYATILVIGLIGALVANNLARAVSRADAAMARVIESIAADAFEQPAQMPPGFGGFAEAADKTLSVLRQRRAERHARIDYLQGLIDTVAASLFVLEPEGDVTPINRAAQKLAAKPVRRLADLGALGPQAAASLTALPPGGRLIVSLADGRQVMASAAAFTVPGGTPRRLIALQSIVGELDVVEQKAWRDLVRILAHEMMNSLTPIVSLSESLGRRVQSTADADQEVTEAIEVISRRSSGLMTFVDRYRQVAEVPQPRRQVLRLDCFAADIERLLGASFREAGVAFACEVSPADLSVDADRDLLEQAVINLLKNAGQAVAQAPSPTVDFSCREEAGRVVISVADNGPGVPDAQRHDIFVPFFSTRPDGSGVGLSLAREIALAHGGRIEVADRRPSGAVFRIVI